MDRKPLIDRMNPFLKILVLILITLIGSFDYKPFISGILVVSILVTAELFSSLSIMDILNSVKVFLLMSIGFMTVIILSRIIGSKPVMMVSVAGLGFRIILISIYSAVFVKTTDPTEFVMSLIKYFRMPVKVGYAFLTAYRFLPTFKDELRTIKYAHQVRGIAESRNPVLKVWNSQRYIIPMMANAVRKGIRISMAMETRAFGKYNSRTFYRRISINKNETVYVSLFILYIIFVTAFLYLHGFASFGFKVN